MDSATRRSLRDLTQHGPLQKHYSCDLSGFLTRWATMIRRSWMAAMTGGSVEATLELWALSPRDVKGRIRPLFQQERMAVSAGLFLDALLGPERRKSGWMRAEAAGDPGRWRQQALLGRAQWARMLCVTWCATTPSRPSLSQMPCWFWTRRAS